MKNKMLASFFKIAKYLEQNKGQALSPTTYQEKTNQEGPLSLLEKNCNFQQKITLSNNQQFFSWTRMRGFVF